MTTDYNLEARSSSLLSFSLPSSLRQLDFDRVLALVILEARTARGREIISLLSPATDHDTVELRQKTLSEMRSLISADGLLPFSGLEEVPAEEEYEEGGFAEAWRVLRAVKATAALREAILRTRVELSELNLLAERIPILDELVSSINRYFDADGRLREDATPELRKVRKRIISRRGDAQKELEQVIRNNTSNVQEELVTLRGDRYCIPVRTERRAAVPGILHERSGSGASLYIEPLEVVEINNDIADLSLAEQEEIRRIERLVIRQLQAWSKEIDEAVSIAAELDAIQAAAIFGNTIEAARPAFSTKGDLRLLEARHPLLDPRTARLRLSAFGEADDTDVVPTTIEMGRDKPGLVISGPNAGGKTVALKTAGLLTAMACAGLPVPTSDGTVIPVPDQIHILIGDEQDVLGHLSTFSGYLTRLKAVLGQVTERSLVLLDELGSGTDPDEGSALAVAVVEQLLERGSLFILTTHLGRVQSFAIAEEKIINASMEFEEADHRPTFRLIRDMPGRSRALEVARQVGLSPSLIDRAREIAGDASAAADELLSQLQKIIDSNRALSRELEQREETLASKEREADDLITKVRTEKKQLAKEWREESDRLRREVRQRLREEVERIRTAGSSEIDRSIVSEASEDILGESEERVAGLIEEEELDTTKITEGVTARHRTFGVEGTVATLEGDRAELTVRGKRMKVDLSDLEFVRSSEPREKKSPQPTATAEPSDLSEQAIELELNLIGKRVEEALESSDAFLDRAMREGKRTIRIIHGHGTGRLRNAVREWLSNHPSIRDHRPGKPREGGNGATIANLR